MNLCFCLSVYLITWTGTLKTEEIPYWKNLKGFCKSAECHRALDCNKGIFCANFYNTRGRFPPCKSGWCGKCYIPFENVKFPIAKLLDEDGQELVDQGGGKRFVEARNGDHLMVPFQCELCHFRNVYGREPEKQSQGVDENEAN